jgi:hypothetical protein
MTSRLWPTLTAILLLVGIAPSQDQKMTPEQVNQYVQHLMSIQVAFIDGVPPGVSVEAKEVSRKGASGNDLRVQYHNIPERGSFRGTVPRTQLACDCGEAFK